MKILIVNASPRQGGNTETVLRMIKEKLEKNNSVEFLDAYKINVTPCLACDGCKANGGHCVRNDDSDKFIQKVADADVLIFGTPVYWWGMSAQLKLLVDKFYSRDSEFKTMNKKVGVVIVGANGTENPQYRLIEEQFACIMEYLNWNKAFSLSFSAYEKGEISKNEELNSVIEKAVSAI